jgi:hypothetical protein
MSVISTSKIKKITVIRKKRRENDSRAGKGASKPHSKDEGFSREVVYSWLIIKFNMMRAVEITIGSVRLVSIKATSRTF